jgi:hypothetical protein
MIKQAAVCIMFLLVSDVMTPDDAAAERWA